MDLAPRFDQSLIASTQSTINTDHWENVMNWYDEGKYHEALVGVLDYINPELAARTGNADRTEFSIPHGSVVLNLKIQDDTFLVNAPFLKVPEKHPVPLLRQVVQINFSPLTLPQIELHGNELTFAYACPLELCEPWKIYDIFRQICIHADNYDDEFIEKFGAQWIQQPKIKKYPPETTQKIWDTVQQYIAEAIDYLDYFESKRWFGLAWDSVVQAMMKIDYYVAPQGVLRTDLEKIVAYLQNKKIPVTDRLSAGRQYLEKLKNYPREEFEKSIYISDIFVPVKYAASLENVKENFTNSYKTAQDELNAKNYMGAVFTIEYIFLQAFYNTHLPNDIAAVLTQALTQASQKTWKEAAKILWQTIDNVMKDNLKLKKSKGFFKRIFG